MANKYLHCKELGCVLDRVVKKIALQQKEIAHPVIKKWLDAFPEMSELCSNIRFIEKDLTLIITAVDGFAFAKINMEIRQPTLTFLQQTLHSDLVKLKIMIK